jgi:hypothetical protein
MMVRAIYKYMYKSTVIMLCYFMRFITKSVTTWSPFWYGESVNELACRAASMQCFRARNCVCSKPCDLWTSSNARSTSPGSWNLRIIIGFSSGYWNSHIIWYHVNSRKTLIYLSFTKIFFNLMIIEVCSTHKIFFTRGIKMSTSVFPTHHILKFYWKGDTCFDVLKFWSTVDNIMCSCLHVEVEDHRQKACIRK